MHSGTRKRRSFAVICETSFDTFKKNGGNTMIFCVEDDKNIRELVVYTLNTTGMPAKGLESGKALWEALAEEKPYLNPHTNNGII